MTYDINTIYTKYKQLTKKQRQQLLAALQSQGINIVKIEAYEYADAPGIKHLFFYFAEDSRKAVSVQKCHNAPICGLFAKPANFIFKFLSLKISLIQADCHRKQVLIVRSTRFHCFE